MMVGSWQDVVALSLVLAALAYLVRRFRGVTGRTTSAGCSAGCGSCSLKHGTPVVTIGGIGSPKRSARS
jgi:hypothetical protein